MPILLGLFEAEFLEQVLGYFVIAFCLAALGLAYWWESSHHLFLLHLLMLPSCFICSYKRLFLAFCNLLCPPNHLIFLGYAPNFLLLITNGLFSCFFRRVLHSYRVFLRALFGQVLVSHFYIRSGSFGFYARLYTLFGGHFCRELL